MAAARVVTLHRATPAGWIRAANLAAYALALGFTGWGASASWSGADIAPVYALLVTAATYALLARWTGREPALTVAATRVVTASTALIAVAALSRLGDTAVRSYGEGYADAIWQEFLGFVALCVGVAWVGSLPAERPTAAAREDGASFPRRRAVVVLVVMTAALARTLAAPPFEGRDAWFHRLPRIGVLPEPAAAPPAASSEARWTLGGVSLRETCEGDRCDLSLLTSTAHGAHGVSGRNRSAIDLRLDEAHNVIVARPLGDGRRRMSAIDRTTGAGVNLRVWHLARGHAPPRPWLVAALVGVGASLLLSAALRRTPRRLGAWTDADEGSLSDAGVLTLSDGHSHPLVTAPCSIAGPVLVRGARRGAAPFRESTAAQEVLIAQGSPATLRARIDDVHRSGTELAAALAVASCTPLIVEARCQLVAR